MKLGILHLSDIHTKNESEDLFKLIKEIPSCFFQVAREADKVLIIVTGDIAFSGSK